MEFNRYSIAGLLLLVAGFIWLVYMKRKNDAAGGKGKKSGPRNPVLPNWVDVDLVSGLWIYPLFFVVWFGGNILLGNMVGIQAIINWINTLNTSGTFSLSPWAIAAIGLAPSTAQWWIKQFAPPTDKTYWVTWAIIGVDVGLNTFGFWALADMPIHPHNWTPQHMLALLIFGALAAFVNIYCENMVHDALNRLMLWFKGQPMKGALS
ncbi:MAG: hypothetical protein ACPGWR_27180 [Ardenticatenaceae bacterium]